MNGTETQYYLNGSTILTQITGDDRLDFFYDENGLLIGFFYNGTKYYYQRNFQGDITGIQDGNGVLAASYTYDSWGKLTSIEGTEKDTIGVLNPFRYRGYYYDTESGFYYLNSRYYDPVVGRFLNADGYISTNQGISEHNMFAYCGNNPINRADTSGQFWGIIIGVTFALGLIASLSGCSNSNVSDSKPDPYSGQANCYAYAMNLEYDPRTGTSFQTKPQPGEFAGNGLTASDLRGSTATVKRNINRKVLADARVLNFNYVEVSSADHVAKPGNWVVALVYATDGSDYHWYRRNDDGTWSHKPGSTPIISWDASGNIITDPATCDRGIYDGFLGYYEVGPN